MVVATTKGEQSTHQQHRQQRNHDVSQLSVQQLQTLLKKKESIIRDKQLTESLPDRGEKIKVTIQNIKQLLLHRDTKEDITNINTNEAITNSKDITNTHPNNNNDLNKDQHNSEKQTTTLAEEKDKDTDVNGNGNGGDGDDMIMVPAQTLFPNLEYDLERNNIPSVERVLFGSVLAEDAIQKRDEKSEDRRKKDQLLLKGKKGLEHERMKARKILENRKEKTTPASQPQAQDDDDELGGTLRQLQRLSLRESRHLHKLRKQQEATLLTEMTRSRLQFFPPTSSGGDRSDEEDENHPFPDYENHPFPDDE